MTVLIVSSQHRSPKHLLPGAPPLSSHRLHTPAAHPAPALNRPVEYASRPVAASPQSSPAFSPQQFSSKPSPGNAAAEPNPHSRLTAHKLPAGSCFAGFRTPAPSASTAHTRPASETLVWTAPASQGLVAAGDGSGRLRSCVRP